MDIKIKDWCSICEQNDSKICADCVERYGVYTGFKINITSGSQVLHNLTETEQKNFSQVQFKTKALLVQQAIENIIFQFNDRTEGIIDYDELSEQAFYLIKTCMLTPYMQEEKK